MFAYPVPDRDHERVLHDLDVLSQMAPATPAPAPRRGHRILRMLARSAQVAVTAH